MINHIRAPVPSLRAICIRLGKAMQRALLLLWWPLRPTKQVSAFRFLGPMDTFRSNHNARALTMHVFLCASEMEEVFISYHAVATRHQQELVDDENRRPVGIPQHMHMGLPHQSLLTFKPQEAVCPPDHYIHRRRRAS